MLLLSLPFSIRAVTISDHNWKKIDVIENELETFSDEVRSNSDGVVEKLDKLKEFEIFQKDMQNKTDEHISMMHDVMAILTPRKIMKGE